MQAPALAFHLATQVKMQGAIYFPLYRFEKLCYTENTTQTEIKEASLEELIKTEPKKVSMVMEYGGFGVSANGLSAFAEKNEGLDLLAALHFNTVDEAAQFAGKMKEACIDSSVMLYKANCVPALLLKPPVIASEATIDYILNVIDTLLA